MQWKVMFIENGSSMIGVSIRIKGTCNDKRLTQRAKR